MINCSIKNHIVGLLDSYLDKKGVKGHSFEILRPDTPKYGDFSSNIAMGLAGKLKTSPHKIAEDIIELIDKSMFKRVEIAGPGFINFFLSGDAFIQWLRYSLDDDFGRWNTGAGKKVQVEFVSANPTGPVTVANGRGAPLGDTIARLLEWTGHDVSREFYVNDRGAKIGNLARSLEERFKQVHDLEWTIPEEGYPGEYLLDIANEIKKEYGKQPLEMDDETWHQFFRNEAVNRIIQWQRDVFSRFGIDFDVWFSEKKMVETGEIDNTIARLRDSGMLYEKDGATWMRSTDLGDDKDFVIIKSNGDATYTATDITYHINKFNRGFDHLIDVMGADHHGHVGPMEAGLEALGYDKNKLEFHLYQLVHLFKDGKQVKMSKSSGEFVTLEELLEEIGVDVSRYFYLMRTSDTHLNFDIDQAKSKSMDNPAYYVQYAHVRCNAIMGDEKAVDVDLENISAFTEDAELNLIRELISFPDEIASASFARAPNRIATYAEKVAGAFHHFYHKCRVLDENDEIRNRRLLLVKATRCVLKSALAVLGVSAPERM